MIPAIAVVASPAGDSGVASVGDSATLLEGEADGRFAAALQQLLDTAEGPASGIDGSEGLAEGSDQGAAESAEQSAVLLQAQETVAILNPAPNPNPNPNPDSDPEPQAIGVPGAADPLHWLMMMQGSAASPPATASGSEVADTINPASLATDATAGDGSVSAPGTAAADAARVSSMATVLTGNGLDTGGSDRTTSEPPPAPQSADSLRTATGLEQNIGHRSPTEAVPRSPPPPVLTPLHAPQWSQEFAARVNWLVDRGDQMATIRLTPEQLGPVEVRLAIREGEASIWFGAAQAETRAAIEQALPRLREMLAASGLSLADSGVFQQAPRDPRQGFLSSDARRAALESASSPGELQLRSRHLGLIDDYA